MIVVVLASVVVWSGTAQVDVMIREPGGEHPYTTDFTLEYQEAAHEAVTARGTRRELRLIPRSVAIDVRHEVRHEDGRSICRGGGQEQVKGAPEGVIALAMGAAATYQLVLPRAVGAFACGSRRNAGDRWVVIGSGLFRPEGDVDAADAEARRLESGGSRMRGEFRFSDASHGGPVRHDYHVRWNLERQILP